MNHHLVFAVKLPETLVLFVVTEVNLTCLYAAGFLLGRRPSTFSPENRPELVVLLYVTSFQSRRVGCYILELEGLRVSNIGCLKLGRIPDFVIVYA